MITLHYIEAFFSTVMNVLSAHPTLNGKAMNIWQAVDAFCDKVMKGRVAGNPESLRARVFSVMASVW